MKTLVLALAGLALLGAVPVQGVGVSAVAPLDEMAEPRITNGLLPGGYASHTCGGVAPSTSSCTTGLHARTGPGWVGPGSGAGCQPPAVDPAGVSCDTSVPGYTGSIRWVINYYLHDAGLFQQRFRTCDIFAGVYLACSAIGGAPPPAGPPYTTITVYEHTCQSFELFTQTPGGTGAWRCFTYHNVSPAGLFG